MNIVRKIEHALFYYLLQRNIRQNRWRVDMPNGCLYLLPKYDVDVRIKTSKVMRREAMKIEIRTAEDLLNYGLKLIEDQGASMTKQSLDESIDNIIFKIANDFGGDLSMYEPEELETIRKIFEQFLSDVLTEVLPEKKPEYVKQRAGRDLYDVPAASFNSAIDITLTNLNNLLGEKQ